MGLFENVRASIDSMGQVELSGVKLEAADARLLDPGSLDLDRHVAMQPSAIAYYGAMLKEANRRLTNTKHSYERWEKKQWALAKAAVLSGTTAQWKPTLADIEARFIADNEPMIEDWEKRVEKAQEESDTLEAWYEGWRQKSFSLREHVSIDENERYQGGNSVGSGDGNETTGYARSAPSEGKLLSSDKIQEVRDIMRKRRDGHS